MIARVDQRDVIERAEDVIRAAEFEADHPGIELDRCECGAARLVFLDPADELPVCAGCLLPPTYELLPAPHSAQREAGAACHAAKDSRCTAHDPGTVYRPSTTTMVLLGAAFITAAWVGLLASAAVTL